MRSVYEERVAESTKIERQIRQRAAKIASVTKFGIVCKALWPFKTAAHIASIADTNERTAARWLSGEFEPPGILIAAIVVEITQRNGEFVSGNGGRGASTAARRAQGALEKDGAR